MVDQVPSKTEELPQSNSSDETPTVSVVDTETSISSTEDTAVKADASATAEAKETEAKEPATDSSMAAETPSADADSASSTNKGKGDKAKSSKKPKKTKAKYYIPVKIGQQIEGKIKTVTDFGAFVDINLSVDGLIHISELSRRRVDKVTDVVAEGEEVTVWVKSIDKERGRVGLTMLKPIERKYGDISEGDELEGEIKRIENYGVFVDIGLEREGLVHISELAHDFVKFPAEVVAVGDIVPIKVLKIDVKKKQVNLSMKAMLEPPEPEMVEKHIEEEKEEEGLFEQDPIPTSMAVAFGLLDANKPVSRKKKAKRNKRSRNLDDVINRTLKAQR